MIALVKFAMPPLWAAPTGLFSHLGIVHHSSVPVLLARQKPQLDLASDSESRRASAPNDKQGMPGGVSSSESALWPTAQGNGVALNGEIKTASWRIAPVESALNFAAIGRACS
jgi:hypothetical protein